MKSVLLALTLFASSVTAQELPRVFVHSSETLNASNTRDKGKHIDFGASLSAALVKKKVPVMVVTDVTKAQWEIKSVSSSKEDSTGTKVAKMMLWGGGSFTQFEGTIQVIDLESSGVLFAYNVKKGNFQSAAEAFAKHFHNDFLKKR